MCIAGKVLSATCAHGWAARVARQGHGCRATTTPTEEALTYRVVVQAYARALRARVDDNGLRPVPAFAAVHALLS